MCFTVLNLHVSRLFCPSPTPHFFKSIGKYTEKRGRGRPRKVKPAIKENLAQDPNIDTTSDKPAQEENGKVLPFTELCCLLIGCNESVIRDGYKKGDENNSPFMISGKGCLLMNCSASKPNQNLIP